MKFSNFFYVLASVLLVIVLVNLLTPAKAQSKSNGKDVVVVNSRPAWLPPMWLDYYPHPTPGPGTIHADVVADQTLWTESYGRHHR